MTSPLTLAQVRSAVAYMDAHADAPDTGLATIAPRYALAKTVIWLAEEADHLLSEFDACREVLHKQHLGEHFVKDVRNWLEGGSG